ncbi:MAG: HNH nuclease family protein, partial [Desulfobacterales bacterium]|nr:HNH nuclease family protein [Desulfobacterales bacterium]
MSAKTPTGQDSHNRTIAEARQAQKKREKTYRERALNLYPHVCGRCGREFSGKKLAELTVHHRDHNHDYNPPDGSNWELLCIYCHENEHTRHLEEDAHGGTGETEAASDPGSTHRPFADLAALLNQ